MLQIGEVQKEDFGTYKCIAKNPRGQTDGQITLTGKLYFILLEMMTFDGFSCFSHNLHLLEYYHTIA